MFEKEKKKITCFLASLSAATIAICLSVSESFLGWLESTSTLPTVSNEQQSRLQGVKTFYQFHDGKISTIEVKSESSQLCLLTKSSPFEIEENMQGVTIKMQESDLKSFPKEVKVLKAKEGTFRYFSKFFKASDIEMQILYASDKDEHTLKKGVLAHAQEAEFDLSRTPIQFSAKDMIAHVLEKTP